MCRFNDLMEDPAFNSEKWVVRSGPILSALIVLVLVSLVPCVIAIYVAIVIAIIIIGGALKAGVEGPGLCGSWTGTAVSGTSRVPVILAAIIAPPRGASPIHGSPDSVRVGVAWIAGLLSLETWRCVLLKAGLLRLELLRGSALVLWRSVLIAAPTASAVLHQRPLAFILPATPVHVAS